MSKQLKLIALCGLIAYVGLSFAYNFANPLFESPDERLHYEFVRVLQDERILPAVDLEGPPTEYHQPPLYYVLTAVLTAPLSFPEIEPLTQANPFWGYLIGEVGSDNKNQYLHDPLQPTLHPGTIPIHLMRAVSTMLGLTSIILTYLLVRYFLSEVGAVAAAISMAMVPNFIFTSASITNDSLAMTVSASVCLYFIRILHLKHKPTTRHWILLGILLAAALLTKLNIWPLLVIAALTVALLALRHRSISLFLLAGGILLAIVLLLGGWWLLRNQSLYGDPTALAANAATWGTRGALGFEQTLIELVNMRTTFWANFGYGNVPVPTWLYTIGDTLLLGGMLGLALSWIRAPQWIQNIPKRDSAIVLFAYLMLIFLGLLLSMPNQIAVTGRHFYPALPIVFLVMVAGWPNLISSEQTVSIALPISLGIASLVTLFTVLIPAYQPVKAATLPNEGFAQLDWQVGEVATLIGYQADDQVEPSATAEVTLYWQATRDLETNYVLFAHLYDMQGQQVGKRDTYPDSGKYPTIYWRTNDIIQDRIRIPVSPSDDGPYLMPLEVGLYNLETGERLPITDPAGNEIGFPVIGSIKLAQQERSTQAPESASKFGELAYLTDTAFSATSVSAGQSVTATLDWFAVSASSEALVVFVHIVDENGEIIAQSDSIPRAGMYPTTAWEFGETFSDVHQLSLPQEIAGGAYDVRIGFYDPNTFQRLLTDAEEDAVTLSQFIQVVE